MVALKPTIMPRCMLREIFNMALLICPVSLDQLWDMREREREGGCDTPHRTLMRGREPKELGNEIRCNSIQLLLSRHGWRFKTHPVKIRFTDEEEDCSSHLASRCYAATASHSQQLWFISTRGVIRLRQDLVADSAMFWYRFKGKCRNDAVFTHRSTAPQRVVLSVCLRLKEPSTSSLSLNKLHSKMHSDVDTQSHSNALAVTPLLQSQLPSQLCKTFLRHTVTLKFLSVVINSASFSWSL